MMPIVNVAKKIKYKETQKNHRLFEEAPDCDGCKHNRYESDTNAEVCTKKGECFGKEED